MICKPCGLAGDLVQQYRNSREKGEIKNESVLSLPSAYSPTVVLVDFRDVIENLSEHLHSLCGNSCDCQHAIDFEGKSISFDGKAAS